jgi:hypothetical protein
MHQPHTHVFVADLGRGIRAYSRRLPDGTLAMVINERIVGGDKGVRDAAHALFVRRLGAANGT